MTASEPKDATYRLKFLPQALDEWNALDGSVKEVLRKQGYRLVYQVDDGVLVVLVLAVDKREDFKLHTVPPSSVWGVEHFVSPIPPSKRIHRHKPTGCADSASISPSTRFCRLL